MLKQYILPALVGGLIVFVILKVLYKAKQPKDESSFTKNLYEVVKTSEAISVLKSKEFRALVKTPEFKKMATDYGTEELSKLIIV